MQTQTRIVLGGISGVRKEFVAGRIKEVIARNRAFGAQTLNQRVKILSAEGGVTDTRKFLSASPSKQKSLLRQSYWEALHALRLPEYKAAEVLLIPTHFTFVHFDRAFSPLSWPVAADGSGSASLLLDFLRKLRPTFIVNLIDDIHFIQHRIRKGPSEIELQLREIIKWRDFETLAADFSANEIIRSKPPLNGFVADQYERSPLFATQHDAETLYRYIFSPNLPRVYASFPISRVRRERKEEIRDGLIEEANEFVAALSSRFTTFNPVTVDEVPLHLLYKEITESTQHENPPEWVDFPILQRWPIPTNGKLSPPLPPENLKIRLRDLEDVSQVVDDLGMLVDEQHSETVGRSMIARQVVPRDLRMIDQSDCVAIYRPKSPPEKNWSRGVRAEYNYARSCSDNHRPFMKIYIVTDKLNDGQLWEESTRGEVTTFEHESQNVTVIDSVGDLHKPENRKEALENLVDAIEADSSRLTYRRRTE